MSGSDAGKYEVKIESIVYYDNDPLSPCYHGYLSSTPYCNLLMLPLLETYYAIHTPVTFTVQEHYIPTYDPQPIVSSYSIPECLYRGGCNIDLRSSGHNIIGILLPAGRYQSEDLNITHNSSVINEERFVINSLQIIYNNTEDIIGNYVGLTQSGLYEYLGCECQVYFYYLCFIYPPLVYDLFTFEFYWKISGELIFSNLLCNLVQHFWKLQ